MKGGGPFPVTSQSPWPNASKAKEPTTRDEDDGNRWTWGECPPDVE